MAPTLVYVALVAILAPLVRAQNQDCDCDVVMVLDKSGSIPPADWSKVQDFATTIVDDLDKGGRFAKGANSSRVGVVSFSDTASLDLGLQTDANKLKYGIKMIQKTSGTTDLADAVLVATKAFDAVPPRPNGCKTMKIMTDGYPDDETAFVNAVAAAKKSPGPEINVVIVAVGAYVDQQLLKSLVSPPKKKNYIHKDDFSGLVSVAHALFDKCAQANTPAVNQSQSCGCDVMLVLDMSGSISAAEWKFMTSFAQIYAHAYRHRMKMNKVRLGLTTYANSARLNQPLTYDYPSMASAIRRAPRTGGGTNTAAALTFATRELVSALGQGNGTCQTIKLVTDGRSNSYSATVAAAYKAKSKYSINIIAVGVGNNLNRRELAAVASQPVKKNMFVLKQFNQLTTLAHKLADKCDDTLNGTTPVPGPRDPCHCDLYLLVDTSGSISKTEFGQIQTFLKGLVNNLAKFLGPKDVRISLIEFASTARVDVKQSYNINELLGSIDNSLRSQKGATYTNKGLDLVGQLINSDPYSAGKCKTVKVITDGRSTNPRATAIAAHKLKKVNDVTIHAFGIGPNVPKSQLQIIASPPSPGKQTVWYNVKFADLNTLASKLVDVNCKNGPKPTPTLNPAPAPLPPQNFCNCDIMLVLDASGSVASRDWIREKNFAALLVRDLKSKMSPTGARVGIVRYASSSQLISPLSYSSRALQDTIRRMRQTKGGTNTQAAIYTANYELTRSRRAKNRKSHCKTMIVLTDGRSNNQAATLRSALRAKMAKVKIIAVGIGPRVNKVELTGMASAPKTTNTKLISSFSGLDALAHAFGDKCKVGGATKTPPVPPNYNTCHCDYSLVLDASLSIGKANFPRVIEFAKIIQMGLSPNMAPTDARMAITTFALSAQNILPLTGDKNAAAKAAASIPLRLAYGTNTGAGLNVGGNQLVTNSRGLTTCKRILLLTDGGACCCGKKGTNCKAQAYAAAHRLKSKYGVEIYAYGIGNRINVAELNTISSSPNSAHVRMIPDFKSLAVAAHALIDKCNPNMTPTSYQRDCKCDIMLVFDGSGSVPRSSWPTVKGFCNAIATGLKPNLDNNSARIGIIVYSSRVYPKIPISGSYSAITAACNAMTQPRRGTSTHAALYSAGRYLARAPGGKRACRAIKLLTDGRSSNPRATKSIAEQLKRKGIKIYVVAIGNNLNLREMSAVASRPAAANMRHIKAFSDLGKVAQSLVGKCSSAVFNKGSKCNLSAMMKCTVGRYRGCALVTKYSGCASTYKCPDMIKIWCDTQFTKYNPYKGCSNTRTTCAAANTMSKCNVRGYSACYRAITRFGRRLTYCQRINRIVRCAEGAGCPDLVTYRCQHRSSARCGKSLSACSGIPRETFESNEEFDSELSEILGENSSSPMVAVLGAACVVLAGLLVALALKLKKARSTEELHEELIDEQE